MIKFFISISLLFSISICSAQIDYGITGGMNLTSLKLDEDYFIDQRSVPRMGFNIGLVAETYFSRNFLLLGDINLISKNFGLNVSDFYGETAKGYDRYNLLYVDLGVKAGITFNPVRVFGGLYFDYLLKSTNQYSVSYPSDLTNEATASTAEEFEIIILPQEELFPMNKHYPFDTGLVFGVGHRNENFSLDLTYSLGLLNIFPDHESREQNPMYTRILKVGIFFYL